MGKPSRDKGKRGEREVVKLLVPVYGDEVRRGFQSREGDDESDVEGTPWWIEVKRTKARANPAAALRQALEATDGRPCLVFTRVDKGEWLVHMKAADFIPLLVRAEEVSMEAHDG